LHINHMGAASKALRRRHQAYSLPRLDAVHDHKEDLISAGTDDLVATLLQKTRADPTPCETSAKVVCSVIAPSMKSSLKRGDFRRQVSNVSWSPVLTEVIEIPEIKSTTSRVLRRMKNMIKNCVYRSRCLWAPVTCWAKVA